MLDSNITNGEIRTPEFSIFRRDRNYHGGGVACYILQSLKCFNISLNSKTEDLFCIISQQKMNILMCLLSIGLLLTLTNSNFV